MSEYTRTTPTQQAILDGIEALREKLRADGFGNGIGTDGIYSRKTGRVEICGATVFGFSSTKQKKEYRFDYPIGWQQDIEAEMKKMFTGSVVASLHDRDLKCVACGEIEPRHINDCPEGPANEPDEVSPGVDQQAIDEQGEAPL